MDRVIGFNLVRKITLGFNGDALWEFLGLFKFIFNFLGPVEYFGKFYKLFYFLKIFLTY
jgi:hypothetical protein